MTNVTELAEHIRAGERRALARAITLVESSLERDQAHARELLQILLPFTGNSLRVGVSGAPGVGKSSLIEALGLHLLHLGHRVAVLAVDPSSALHGGSILGDKTRMPELSASPRAFVRPSPAGKSLGGIAERTREAILVCEAAGFDIVLVETVGVGQSEVAVAHLTDLFLLLALPGAGDELQGLKRGILELIDLLAITKADGTNLPAAERARADYGSALRILHHALHTEPPPVLTVSAHENHGIDSLWSTLLAMAEHARANGAFAHKRAAQRKSWFAQSVQRELHRRFFAVPETQARYIAFEQRVFAGELTPDQAAHELLLHTK